MQTPTLKSVELFAGAGGLGIGLHQAGFEPVRVVERDAYCCETIRENSQRNNPLVSKWKVIPTDIREVDFSDLSGRVDLVSGGPPCQPFSMGGKHRAYDDARDMFPAAIRVLREVQPKAFIFENVKGLTRASFQNYFEYIQLQMRHPEVVSRNGEDWVEHYKRLEQHHTSGSISGLNYRLVVRLLNSANFGVPQKRERVLFVGFRDDLGVDWSFPDETHSIDRLIWDQYVDYSYWDRHEVPKKDRILNPLLLNKADRLDVRPKCQAWRTVRDALEGLPDPEISNSNSVLNHKLQPGARSYPGHTGSPLDLPAKTLKAGVHGVPGGENMLLKPNGAVRYFTVRESARLQTFPDDYVFHGSWSETMRQLGNAVPVGLAEAVGKSVSSQLRKSA